MSEPGPPCAEPAEDNGGNEQGTDEVKTDEQSKTSAEISKESIEATGEATAEASETLPKSGEAEQVSHDAVGNSIDVENNDVRTSGGSGQVEGSYSGNSDKITQDLVPQKENISNNSPVKVTDGSTDDLKSQDVNIKDSGVLPVENETVESIDCKGSEQKDELQPFPEAYNAQVNKNRESSPPSTTPTVEQTQHLNNDDENNATEGDNVVDATTEGDTNQNSTADAALDNPTNMSTEDVDLRINEGSPASSSSVKPVSSSTIDGDNETIGLPGESGNPTDVVTESIIAQDAADNVSTVPNDTPKSDSPIKSPTASVVKSSEKVVMFEDVEASVRSSPGIEDENNSDLSKSPTSTIRELAPSRNSATTTMTEFAYDENEDFKTPEFYERCLQPSVTPSVTESEKMRQEAGSRRNLLSRGGESSKSVTFADEVMSQDDVTDIKGEDVEDSKKGEGEEGADKNEDSTETEKPNTEEEPSVFPTAVSAEKIAEATARAIGRDGGVDTQSVAVDLWGQSKFELESMGDVVNKRATEHFEKGCKLSDQGDHCQAILCFDKAINLCPKMVTYYLARGESYTQICDFQSAILNLKRACVLDPDNNNNYSKLAFVYYFYGQTLFDQNLFAEALEAFSRASEMRPEVVGYHTRGDVRAYFSKRTLLSRTLLQGMYIYAFRLEYRQSSHAASFIQLRSDVTAQSVACLAALQRHGECLALVNKRLEMEQENPDLYIMRARLHELFRNTSLCYYDLKDALALDPDLEEARMLMKRLEVKAQESRNHSVTLQLQGKLKDALNKITTAIETNPSKAEYHLLRGALHRRLQDYNAAIDDYLLALDKTEHNEHDNIYTESQRQLLLTYNDFAVECFLGKHYEEAIILLNKALKGEKREKGLYVNRGDCFFRLNELHFALADYHQALEIDSTDWMVRSRIAAIHSEFGMMDYDEHNYQEAEARFVVAIQHSPRMGTYYVNRAKVRFMLENHSEARQDLLMALHLDPSNDDILSLMPRLFPGKTVGDVMRSKAAKMAKMAIDNAVVTASPVKLPEIRRESDIKVNLLQTQQGSKTPGGTAKHVAFATNGVPPRESSSPGIRECMSEIQFNKGLTKQKNKISTHVKSLLNERKTLANSPLTLAPQPPPRPYKIQGGGWKKDDSSVDTSQGWKTFSLGMGIMNK